ncbi:unnamed protein product, partial [Ixodes persulcatus]
MAARRKTAALAAARWRALAWWVPLCISGTPQRGHRSRRSSSLYSCTGSLGLRSVRVYPRNG